MNINRSLRVAVALGLSLGLAAGVGSMTAAEPVLADSVTAGVVRTNDGFGTSTVLVPSGDYATYLVKAAPALAGRDVEIWTRTRGTDWQLTTTRVLGPDGSARYFSRVSEWTAFWAKLPADGAASGAVSHGRNATISSDGRSLIRLWCDDFVAAEPGSSVLLNRVVGAPVNSLVSVMLCSNASTGYSWSAATISSAHLVLVSHRYSAGPFAIGSAGAETWTFRVSARGQGHAVLSYGQPWEGGDKGVWSLVVTVMS